MLSASRMLEAAKQYNAMSPSDIMAAGMIYSQRTLPVHANHVLNQAYVYLIRNCH